MDRRKYDNIAQSHLWIILLTIAIAYLSSIFFYKLNVDFIGEGDFGRDLYIFYLSSLGKLPYIHYNWIYGPFVPVLYGLYYKIAGISILNTLTLWYLAFFICIYLVYYQVKLFSNAFFGFLAALAFLLGHGFYAHTFNHIFGLPFLLLIVIFIYKYLDNNQPLYIYLVAVSFIFLALVKLNIAIAVVLPVYVVIIAIHYYNKKDLKNIIGSFGLFLLSTITIYGILIINSPLDQIAKSFPYGSKYIMKPLYDYRISLLASDYSLEIGKTFFEKLIAFLFILSTLNIWYILLPVAGIIVAYFIYKREGRNSKSSFFIVILSVSCLANTHEFIITGLFYSLRYWVFAIWLILLFYILEYAIKNWYQKGVVKVTLVIGAFLFINVLMVRLDNLIAYNKVPAEYLPVDRAKVYFTNFPWLYTMYESLQYIKKNSKSNEKILSLPYNSLYNFLTNREQPGRYIEFLYISGLNERDQYKIIEEIEKNRVKLILYSQKQGKLPGGVGVFGKTHCRILDKYIKENYYHDISIVYKGNEGPASANSFYKRKTPFKYSAN